MAVDVNSLFSSFSYTTSVRGSVYPQPVRKPDPVSADETEGTQRQQPQRNISQNDGDGRRSGGFLRQQYRSDERALAQLLPVRATLEPSDEVALFAEEATSQATELQQPATQAGEAVDDNGQSVAVEIITPENELGVSERFLNNVLPLLARQQAQVSQLYARNNDVVFNTPVVTALAA